MDDRIAFDCQFVDDAYPVNCKVPPCPKSSWLESDQCTFIFEYIRPLMHGRLIILVVLTLVTFIAIALA